MALVLPLSPAQEERLASVASFDAYLAFELEGGTEFVGGRAILRETVVESADACIGMLRSVLACYAEERTGGRVIGRGLAQRLGMETARCPDVSYLRPTSLGRIRPTHIEGAADLVFETASPTGSGRTRETFAEFESAGTEEYWIADPERETAEFYRLVEGRYVPVLPDAVGRVHSSTIPGFTLRVSWPWERPKLSTVLRELGVL